MTGILTDLRDDVTENDVEFNLILYFCDTYVSYAHRRKLHMRDIKGLRGLHLLSPLLFSPFREMSMSQAYCERF